MKLMQEMMDRLAYARRSFRTEVDSSLERSRGGWWIPSIVVCAVWAWLANHERKQHA